MIIVSIFALTCSFVIFQKGFIMYNIIPSCYEKAKAVIESIDEYEWRSRTGGEGYSLRLGRVSYIVNNVNYSSEVPLSYLEKKGDNITFAYKKDEPGNSIRCEFLPLSKGVCAINFCCLFILLYYYVFQVLFKLYKRKTIIYKKRKIINRLEDMRRKGIIHSTGVNISIALEIPKDYRWVLEHLSEYSEFQKDFLWNRVDDFKYEIENVNSSFRPYNLKENLFVFFKNDKYYFCINRINGKIYRFEFLKETNTRFYNVYEFLIFYLKNF